MVVTDPRNQAEVLRSWNSGRIITRGGKLVAIQKRRWPMPASIARVWLQTQFKLGQPDECRLDYRSSRLGGFLVLDYVRSGPETHFTTFRSACQILDHIAQLRQAVAILAHVSTDAISDRLLHRWGWEPHAGNMAGRHWIKRFYEGYPVVDLDRYL